jgi:hypothetical protein
MMLLKAMLSILRWIDYKNIKSNQFIMVVQKNTDR